MGLSAEKLRLYLVTDPTLCPGPALVETVLAAMRGGVSFVQLRDKTAPTPALVEMARALKAVLAGSDIPLVINDDLDAAIAADVDGVHLGQEDVTAADARARLGPDKIIGLSCETVQHVQATDPAVIDYLGLGTVFPTATKADHKPTIGFSGLAELARVAPVPTVAIGGLKRAHAGFVRASGCDGMAVVSAICGQPDPEQATAELRRAIITPSEDT